jgi:hypothetical protein
MLSLISVKSKPSTPGRAGGYDSVSVRMARREDGTAIRRLALLDDRALPAGPKLVVEADGQIIAATAIESGKTVADPFRWTAEPVALMEMRATQLRTGAIQPAEAASGAVKHLRTRLT